MARPEQLYQAAFEFPEPRETETGLVYVPSEIITPSSGEESLGRFVRRVEEKIQIRTPSDASRYLMERIFTPFGEVDQEELWVLMLNTKNVITHDSMVYRGTINSALVRVAEVFKPAIRVNAPSILISHCHPSGDPQASREDVRLTEVIVQAGQLLEIDVLDHLIIGFEAYASLKERRLGFA